MPLKLSAGCRHEDDVAIFKVLTSIILSVKALFRDEVARSHTSVFSAVFPDSCDMHSKLFVTFTPILTPHSIKEELPQKHNVAKYELYFYRLQAEHAPSYLLYFVKQS